MDSATTNEAVDKTVDEGITIINQSGWAPVTVSNKAEIIQGHILDEAITKRENNIRALQRGLDNFGVLSVIQKYPHFFSEIFTFRELKVSADVLKGLVDKGKSPLSELHTAAYENFLDYMSARESEPPDIYSVIVPVYLCLYVQF